MSQQPPPSYDWSRPLNHPPKKPRKKPILWTFAGVVAVLVVIGLVAPDKSKTSTNEAAGPSDLPSSSRSVSNSPTVPALATTLGSISTEQARSTFADLTTLPIKGRAPKTGYTRGEFGSAWSDDVDTEGGHNGCDTRNDILRRDLTGIVDKPGTRGCVIASGTLVSPYTNQPVKFVRGPHSSSVQIDHVVALSDAWQTGAQQLSGDERRNLANDPRNLLAADAPSNERKSDGDAATWLPSYKPFRCTYVAQQVSVKKAYRLWVTQAERDAIARVLGSCGAKVPTQTSTPRPPTSRRSPEPVTRRPTPPRDPVVTPEPIEPVAPGGGGTPYYKNCDAVRAAGAAPLLAGSPGYRSELDRDGDGVACESK